jgi:hypothetical protein
MELKNILKECNMKKHYLLFAAVVSVSLVMGCGSSPVSSAQANVPEWVDELPPNDYFWGIGFAKLQNESLGRETATSRARRNVAAQLGTLVQSMLTDYAREAGTLQNSTSIQFIESVTRNVVDMNVSGAVPNAKKRMSDGTWWVRVALKKADAQKLASDIIENEASMYAEFKAQEALRMLDYQIGQAQSVPTPRSED